jgi:PncC family amidohydrolase
MEIMDNPLIDPAVVNSIRDLLLERAETIAVAESVTSGLLQAALSQAVDASKFYQGGITAYNIGQKYKHLNVEPIHASNCDCISEQVASDMALNCCTLFKSDFGLGITGYASIVPEQDNDLLAYCAVAYKKKIILNEKIEAKEAEPFGVQLFYMRNFLSRLEAYLKNNTVSPKEKAQDK